jgi:multiple sugar transport system ATP-binding protein
MFVAGFIGSPAMNFFEAKLDRGNGSVVVDVGPFQLPLPAQKAELLSSHVGKPIYFGIRPEDIHDANYVPRGVDEAARLSTGVNVLEPLGSEVFAYIENGGKEMVGRLDPRTDARVGQRIDVVLDMNRMHIFDRESEKALV